MVRRMGMTKKRKQTSILRQFCRPYFWIGEQNQLEIIIGAQTILTMSTVPQQQQQPHTTYNNKKSIDTLLMEHKMKQKRRKASSEKKIYFLIPHPHQRGHQRGRTSMIYNLLRLEYFHPTFKILSFDRERSRLCYCTVLSDLSHTHRV